MTYEQRRRLSAWLVAGGGDWAEGVALYRALVGALPPLLTRGGESDAGRCVLVNALRRVGASYGLGMEPPTGSVAVVEDISVAVVEEDAPLRKGRYVNIRDPRFKSAPEEVRLAVQRVREIMPAISGRHSRLKVTSDSEANTRKTLLAELRDLVSERRACWDTINKWIDALENEQRG